jgi:NADPH:quinone reductase-like Zn-dependent oxidoreductase
MKAAYLVAHGGVDMFRYGDLPDPVPGPDDVLVDIHAASVNAADWKVRINAYGSKLDFPYVLGRDFSGVVSAVGANVSDLAVGDEVFGVCPAGQEGTYCEKIAIKAAITAKKPAHMSHVDAAAVALIGLTAIVTIDESLKLQQGEKILIHGGAGGVAGFAIQYAKYIGAHVVTTASARNADYVRGLGTDEVIEYNTQNVADVVKDCDCAFDTVGGDATASAFAVLKPGGRAAFIAGGQQPPAPPRADIQSIRPAVGRSRRHMERIGELLAAKAVTVPPVTRFALQDVAKAHEISEGRHLRGKLVFAIR